MKTLSNLSKNVLLICGLTFLIAGLIEQNTPQRIEGYVMCIVSYVIHIKERIDSI